MSNQNRIILFCYAYVIGVILAMTLPIDSSLLFALRMLTSVAFCLSIVYFVHKAAKQGKAGRLALEIILLSLPAIALGYTRYTSANTVPDSRIGVLRFVDEGPRFRLDTELDDLYRLQAVKSTPLSADVTFRVQGDANVRVPVRDEQGNVRMDGAGRWLFSIVKMSITSEIVTVRADDPIGTTYSVLQPFSRITKLDVVDCPKEGAVALYRVSNHISSFAQPGRNHPPVTILGRITADSRVYDFKTVIPVTPDYVQYPPGGPFYRCAGGDIHVTMKPGTDNYATFARTGAYGCSAELSGELSMARAAANPGGFDPRRFLQNHNVYGSVFLFQPPGGAPPIELVVPESGRVRRGNPIVRFSLDLRDRMLLVFKQSMPYPESSFLGAVTLGLRYGLQSVPCILSNAHGGRPGSLEDNAGDDPYVHDDCEESIAEEFKASGVNHVLAVSGLHVTIITLMFIGIFTMLRMPRQVYAPFIIVALIIFAIITGARPSVLRAVIMHSLFLMTWAYLDTGIRSSILLGVPVAAFLILLQNPLVVVDPSFTLSFGAILSLGLITTPSMDLLARLKGNNFLSFLLIVGLSTLIGMLFWPLMVSPAFFVPFGILCAGFVYLLSRMEKKGTRLIGKLGYSDIPPAVGTFMAAQISIQLGMMLPLSAFYFSRWPFAGAYANLIAIPLIGVVVQLAAIGGLLGLIPSIGIYFALIMNAANWIFAVLFLLLAHFFAAVFPYPFMRRPTLRFLVVYYIFCAAYIWWRPIWIHANEFCGKRKWKSRRAPVYVLAGLAVLATIPLWPIGKGTPEPELRITVLSLGYSSSALVESPGGQRILIDCGNVEYERGRRNDATRTILPFLSHNRIRHLDAVVLTSPHVERTAGSSRILKHCWTDKLLLPINLANLSADLSRDDFIAEIASGQPIGTYSMGQLEGMYDELVRNPSWPKRPSLAKELEERHDTAMNRWAGWDVNVATMKPGDVLFEENVGERVFRIEVLSLNPETIPAWHPIENASAVFRIVYGDFEMLFCGDLQFEGQRLLLEQHDAEALQADVLMMPHHGTALPADRAGGFKESMLYELDTSLGPFLDTVKPERVVFDYGNPRGVLGTMSKDAENAFELTSRFVSKQLGKEALLNTDSALAVSIVSSGSGYIVVTQAEANRAAGSETAIEDIDIGL